MALFLHVQRHSINRRKAFPAALLLLLFSLCAAGTLLAPQGFANASSPEFHVPTVLEAIDLALVNGPDVSSALKTVEQAQIGALSARSALSWRLDAAGSHSYRETQFVPGPELNETQSTASLSLQRTLVFDPAVKNQLRKADLGTEQAALMLEHTALETVKAVFEAYRQLELALIQRQVLAESVRVAAMGWDVAISRAETETIAKVDAEEARLDLAAAELEYDASERMLDIARLALAQRLGIDNLPTVDEIPVPSLEELAQAIASRSATYWPTEPVPWGAGIEELKELAIAHRPDVRLALARVRQSEIDVELARLSRRPVVSAEAKYTKPADGEATLSVNSRGGIAASLNVFDLYESTQSQPPVSTTSEVWEVRIGASINLWDSAQAALEIERASSALRQATSDWEQARSGVELDVANRYINAVTAHSRLLLASERTLLALERLAAERRQFELGLATSLSIAARQLDVHMAVAKTFAARLEYEKAVVDLAVSAGFSLEEIRELIGTF